MKKSIALLLACMLLITAFAACSNTPADSSQPQSSAASKPAESKTESTSGSEPAETMKMTYVIPGDAPPEYDRGIKAINDKMAEDGVGVEAEFNYISWDVWDQKLNIMLSTGEKFDAFHVMDDRVSLANYASRGALADITDAMEQYGENIKANVPELALTNGKIGGQQYGIPAFWVETALNEQATIRQDILDKYNIPMPTNMEELTQAYIQVMEQWDGDQLPYFPSVAVNERLPYFFTSSDDFCVYSNVIYVNQDGTIANYFETEDFKEAAKNAKTWYDAGLINPDVLTFTQDQLSNQLNSGNWFVMNGTVGNVSGIQENIPDFKPENIAWLDLTNGAQQIRPYAVKNQQAVPLASEHPEAAVKFFNWVYADQANFDLFMYGTEGVDYTLGENRSYTPIIDATAGQALYSFSGWMGGNINFGYVDNNTAPDVNKHLYTIDETAVDGIAAAFAFDASPVQTQLADVQTVISSTLVPMAWGITDYDSGIDAALEMLKTAGVDDVIAEYQKQFEESQK